MSKIAKQIEDAVESNRHSVMSFRQAFNGADLQDIKAFHALGAARKNRIKALAAEVGFDIPSNPTVAELGEDNEAIEIPADIPQKEKPRKAATRKVKSSRKVA